MMRLARLGATSMALALVLHTSARADPITIEVSESHNTKIETFLLGGSPVSVAVTLQQKSTHAVVEYHNGSTWKPLVVGVQVNAQKVRLSSTMAGEHSAEYSYIDTGASPPPPPHLIVIVAI